jgi:hypothetical protein
MNNEECQCQIFEGDQGWCPVHGTAKDGKKELQRCNKKSEAWDKIGKSGADYKFLWRRHNGEWVSIFDMSTIHLWNALKIAWERRYSKREYWKQAIANLYLELCSRPSLTDEMKATLKVIAKRITKR